MIKAILFDLDNTLLKNPGYPFASEYWRVLEGFLQQRWRLSNGTGTLQTGLTGLPGKPDMETTVGAYLLEMMSAAFGRSVEDILAALAEFYDGAYNELKRCVEPLAVVPALIQFLREHGYAVVIAADPLYSARETLQRLSWAGLPDREDTYALVTHRDNTHFAKPDPAYFAEVLARVGVEPDEALMVGDSLKGDILPATAAGLHTFHVQWQNSGSLDAFFGQVQANWLDSLGSLPLNPAMIEPQLRGNVGALFGMLADVKHDFWTQHPDPNEWSIIQIVCHLRDSETKVQRPRLERILAENNPFLVSPEPPPGPHSPPCDDDGLRVAQQFSTARQVTLGFVATIQTGDWARPARHSIFGPTTLLEMAHFSAQHDRLHLNQLCQTLGRCE